MARIRDLRHKVTFQENTATQDANGFCDTPSWSNIGTVPTVWAKIDPLDSMESYQASQLRGVTIFKITIRDRTDLTMQMRVTATLHSASRTFEILGMRRPQEYPRWLELTCKEVG